jgi:transcriptional regulator with XRE-family HTH domain
MGAKENVARNMRRLRVKLGVSQEAFADLTGIDRTYVSRLERKLENPTVTVLEKVAAALGVEIAELFADPGPADAKPPSLPAGRKKRREAHARVAGRLYLSGRSHLLPTVTLAGAARRPRTWLCRRARQGVRKTRPWAAGG